MPMEIKRKKVSPPMYAKCLGVSEEKVLGFIKSGELKAMNVATSRHNRPRYLIDLADIEAFERSRQVIPDGDLPTTQRLRRKATKGVKEFF